MCLYDPKKCNLHWNDQHLRMRRGNTTLQKHASDRYIIIGTWKQLCLKHIPRESYHQVDYGLNIFF